ncbi:hypothetical protein N8I77_012483 [Diaporthe amygdali]|uniref:Xylanolytic transcriptional activator regulatory domain-containing protein n=1 Tax=Phomopsis amygdali TaxID=1214568 RepID=A0AAD9VYY0_PHOAM|nr:hypothetical protein N8I77_012483 [Diaporthe amygdali]
MECDELVRASLPEGEENDNLPTSANPTLTKPSQNPKVRSGDDQSNLEIENLVESDLGLRPTASAQVKSSIPAWMNLDLAGFAHDTRAEYEWIRAHEDRSSYHSQIFARLPTQQQHILSLTQPIVEELQPYGIMITTESWLHLVDQQCLANIDHYVDSPSRRAVLNSLYASAMLHRATGDFLAEISPTAWSYFKNAFSKFPELITQGRDVSACEALLAMVMFVQCTADVQLTSQITAAVTRLVQTLGLHRRKFYISLDPTAAERHLRTFWLAYILDVDAMEKYNFRPSLGDEELAANFNCGSSPGFHTQTGSLGVLQCRAELAVIQRRVHERLHPNKIIHMNRDELLAIAHSMDRQLQVWKSCLSEEIWKNGPESDHLSLTLLHYAFHNTVSRVHMAVVGLRATEHSSQDLTLGRGESHPEPSIQNAWATCVVSARNTIKVMGNLAPQPFFHLWGTLCYPFSAVLMLLSAILEDPGAATAQDDAGRIEEFVTFLKGLAGDACDVKKMLEACIRLHDVASCAINSFQAGENPHDAGAAVVPIITVAQLESIRAKLFCVKDWLQLAQGLLTNLPLLRAEAEEVLSDILGNDKSQGAYGLFVPELFKSHNQNFSFGT